MKSRFIICIDDATLEQQNKVTVHFKNLESIGFWHWYSDVWLIIDTSGTFTSVRIRSELDDLLPGVNKMVFKVDSGDSWSAFGATKSFEWMNKYWSK